MRRISGLLSLAVALLLFSVPSFAQSNLGRIFGAITDESGGAVAGASVTVIDTARGINRALTADDAGEYNAPNLIPGSYTVHATAAGFQTVDRQNIVVEVGQELRVDLSLKPGAQTQTITVTEALPLVNTTSATVSATIENQDITQLPLNGRNFQSMTDFRPGVQTKPGGGTDARFTNGQQSEENIWLLDGLFNKGTYGGNSVIGGGNLAGEGSTLVPLDTIQEVTFIENPKAEYGWGTGAIVNLGFKSGTNTLHGSAYAYGRDDALQARNPFATQKPGTALEQPGMSLGGPIIKNKLFFFGGYEAKRVVSSTTASITEPSTASFATAGSPNGSTSNSFPDAIYDIIENHGGIGSLSQLSTNLAGCNYTQIAAAAATIKAATNSLAANVAQYCNVANGLFNYSAVSTASQPVQIPNFQHTDNFLAKMDYHISDHNSLNGEYFFGTGNTYSNAGTPVEPWWGSTTPVRGQGLTAVDIWTPNSAWVNEARGGFHIYNQIIGIGECANNGVPPATGKSNFAGYTSGSPNYPSTFGLDVGAGAPCAMPFLTIGTDTGLGNEARGYEPRVETAYKADDQVSYTRGPHVFKVGFEYRLSSLVGGAHGYAQGAINFGTSGINDTALGITNALEDYLAGYTSSGQILVGSPDVTTHQSFYGAFIQDDWRLTQKLTLNLGLRWEYTSPLSEIHDLFGDFVPNNPAVPSGIVQIGKTPGFNSLWHGDDRVFMPRFGIAWDVTGTGKNVFRAGAGTMYAYNATSGMIGNGNIDPNTTPTGIPFYAPTGSPVAGPAGGNIATAALLLPNTALGPVATPGTWAATSPVFNNVTSATLACGEGKAPNVTVGPATAASECGVGGFDPNMKMPVVYYWNADIQHSFGNNLSLDIAYVGNHAQGLIQQTNLNQPNVSTPGVGFPNKTTQIVMGGANPFQPYGATPTLSGAFIEQAEQPYYGTYPWIGAIRWESNRDNSNYNSLQMTLHQRVTHGLDFTATYVYSHALDVVDGEFTANNVENNFNPAGDYGNASYNPFHRFTITGTWTIPSHKAPAQLLQGWKINTVVFWLSKVPYNADDTTDDISGTGTLLDRWTMVGNSKDFSFGSTPGAGGFPCFGLSGSTFASKGCTIIATMPSACVGAASGESVNSGLSSAGQTINGVLNVPANSGLYNLYKYGCYMQGSSVIVPPAQGTYGNMSRDMLYGPGETEIDGSITKDWTFKERYTMQFRIEGFNLINSTQYAVPSANLASPNTFGKSNATINLGGIAIAAGAPRQFQLGLRLGF